MTTYTVDWFSTLDGFGSGPEAYWGKDGPEFMVTKPANGKPATPANGGTIGFAAADRPAVHAFHEKALAAGGTCEGPPGPRSFTPTAYAAYVRDPDGNKLCAYTFVPG